MGIGECIKPEDLPVNATRMYDYKNNLHFQQPKGTIVTYYNMNSSGVFIGRCKKKINILSVINILLLITCLVFGYYTYMQKQAVDDYNVILSDVIQYKDSNVFVNLVNDPVNKYDMEVVLETVDGQTIMSSRNLKPGESIGTIMTECELQQKSVMCIAKITVFMENEDVYTEKSLLLVSEEVEE